MTKILTAQQTKLLDAHTIGHEPVASIDLMERACRAFTTWFTAHFDATHRIAIACGTGNNGGDGLGIARLLNDWGYAVKVWVVRGNISESEDFKINLGRLKETSVALVDIVNAPGQELFDGCDVLIDAIFGSGLSREPEGIFAQVIDKINQANAIRVAVDIPSGLMADKPSGKTIVKAHYTVTFQLPKLAFLLPGSYPYTGEWVAVDIGLSKAFIRNTESPYVYITGRNAKKILKPRERFSHKGTYGHALLVTGSYGKMGAAVLSAKAALRSGLGLLTVHAPKCGYHILQTAVPEAMVSIDPEDDRFANVPGLESMTTVGVGPGLGQQPETVKAFASLLGQFRKPMVIDADGLNILAANRELLHLVPEGSILTPHPKEFERIAGPSRNDFERMEKQQALAAQLRSIVVLKGAYSAIAGPEGKVYFNSSGNPGMATGGTGDVLTGVLTGLLAQKYTSWDAALLGVYVHGLAADLAVVEKGMEGMIASDLIEFLPAAFRELRR